VIQAWELDLREARSALRIVPQTRMRFNPTLESSNLFVPGLIAFVLTIVSALMTSISLTREKELGTMEVLLVSPLRPAQIIIGKVVPYLALGLINVLTTLGVAWLIFDVPFRGSILLLIAQSLLFIFTSLALGILISTRTDSQQVAMMGALAGLMLPTMLLSGFIFPLASMPAPLQVIANIVPAKWFVLIARGIMLKGVGLQHLWQETLILTGMTVALLGISARRFTVRLE
jgi:ABC-2 type transport system permease protein